MSSCHLAVRSLPPGLAIASSHALLPAVVPVVASGVVLLSFGLFMSIVLFNRPKFVVPPTMRNEKGAIDVWLSRSADGWP